ncbi:MAG: flagellar hook-basal body complex protein FliE [bacterium]
MVNFPISPISLAQVAGSAAMPSASPTGPVQTESIFDKVLGRAVDALNNVSETEMNANKLIDDYMAGKVELSDVMLATSRMTVAVQLAVTTITSAVSTFKEITQMPI